MAPKKYLIIALLSFFNISLSQDLDIILTNKQYELSEIPEKSQKTFNGGEYIYCYLKGEIESCLKGKRIFYQLHISASNKTEFKSELVKLSFNNITVKNENSAQLEIVPNPEKPLLDEVYRIPLMFSTCTSDKYKCVLSVWALEKFQTDADKSFEKKFVVENTQDGAKKYKEIGEQIRTLNINKRTVPKIKGNEFLDSELINKVNKLYVIKFEKKNRLIVPNSGFFTEENWTLIRNNLGVITERRIDFVLLYAEKGSCFYLPARVSQDFDGQSYSRPYFGYDMFRFENIVEVNCSEF